jgi:hypothetical protein
MSSCTTRSKLKRQKTSKIARSEFGKSNSVTAKKSTDADKYTILDDGKTTPAAEAIVMGAMSEKAPTPLNVSTAADNTLKDTVMEATVMGDATSEKALVPSVTAANKITIGKKKLAKETAAVPHPNMVHVKYNHNLISKDTVVNTTAATTMSERVVQSAAACTKPSKEASKIMGAAGPEITAEGKTGNNHTTAGPEITTKTGSKSTTAGPEITAETGNNRTTAGPDITAKTGNKITTTAGPEITAKTGNNHTTAGSEITAETGNNCTTAGPEITAKTGKKITTTAGPEITATTETGNKITAAGPEINANQNLTEQNSTDFDVAFTFVMKIKERFATEPEQYKKYMELLNLHENCQLDLPRLIQNVSELFIDHPDLWE